ncbi:hypothetical protein AVEN_41279-1 [Araneus ventricosus]|uniref:Uncharacterized protein n=1 Tax=Araneus ventricosus TaxID=182803 RepID=A0A4Y2S762_ARAVE|nr:hypothetical protein AVEN_41279-1 [Araneus ventricosus]
MVRKWIGAFQDGSTNVYDEERRGQTSVITEDIVQKVDVKVRENSRFAISYSSNEFPQVSRSVFHGTPKLSISSPLQYFTYYGYHDHFPPNPFSSGSTGTSDESFTPERFRGSGSSKGTTGSNSDQKERIRRIGFMMNPRNRIRESELDSL